MHHDTYEWSESQLEQLPGLIEKLQGPEGWPEVIKDIHNAKGKSNEAEVEPSRFDCTVRYINRLAEKLEVTPPNEPESSPIAWTKEEVP